MKWWWLFAGGGLGTMLRYGLAGLVQERAGALFPWGTLAVNLSGCFVLGLLAAFGEETGLLGPGLRRFLFIGVLGGFTTFSTFGLETWNLIESGERLYAALNALGSVAGGLAAVVGGVFLGRVLA